MKFGSLFSGIGGFDLGFERAGLECAWQVEVDKDCQRVLAKQFPKAERFEDVTSIGSLPRVDIFCGGFPCQDLSVAGKREGLAGERSGLWFEFLRVIRTNLPRWVVIENVPGLLSSNRGNDFAVILRGLAECGYSIAWRVLDAQFYGVAQRRRRVFIVGSLGDGSCAEILFERESVSRHPPTRGEAGQRVAATITEHFTGGSNQWAPMNEADNLQVAHSFTPSSHSDYREGLGTIRANGGDNGGGSEMLVAFSSKDHGADAGEIAPTLRSQNFKDSHMNGGGQVAIAFVTTQITSKGNYSNPKEGDPCHPLAEGAHAPAIAFQQDATDKFSEEVTPTMRGKSNGGTRAFGVAAAFGVRRLTPRECERLQGFPDDWTLHDADGKQISDSARYRLLGNAVAVPVAEWIGKRLFMQQG